jgi:hypothetical protein
MNLIEFLGGVRSGKIWGRGITEKRFKDGVQLLGERYSNEKLMGADTMWNLRNALIHQYIPEAIKNNIGLFHILGKRTLRFIDQHAIRPPHFKTGGQIPKSTQIWTEHLINELQDAYEKLVGEIKQNHDLRKSLRMPLWWLPRLQDESL